MKTILNIGCGDNYLKPNCDDIKTINVDQNKEVKCDEVVDLEGKLPYEDSSVSYVVAKHILEHIKNRIGLMNELWRVLESSGKMYIEVPLAGTNSYYKDPTHVSPWVPDTFKYFAEWNMCPAYKIKTWKVESCEVEQRGSDQIIICNMIKP